MQKSVACRTIVAATTNCVLSLQPHVLCALLYLECRVLFFRSTVFCRLGCKTTRIPKDSTISFNEIRQCFHVFISLFGLLDIHSSKWYSIYRKNRPCICISVSHVQTFCFIWNDESNNNEFWGLYASSSATD